jgi:hypothetical protein
MDKDDILRAKLNIIYAIFYQGSLYNQPKDWQHNMGAFKDASIREEWSVLSEEEKILRTAAIYNAGKGNYEDAWRKAGVENRVILAKYLPYLEAELGYSSETGLVSEAGSRSITRAYIYWVRQCLVGLAAISGEEPKVTQNWASSPVVSSSLFAKDNKFGALMASYSSSSSIKVEPCCRDSKD